MAYRSQVGVKDVTPPEALLWFSETFCPRAKGQPSAVVDFLTCRCSQGLSTATSWTSWI